MTERSLDPLELGLAKISHYIDRVDTSPRLGKVNPKAPVRSYALAVRKTVVSFQLQKA